jgi:hypothetical protein
VHGIAGNEWLDRKSGKSIYCTIDTADGSVKPLGTTNPKVGAHSPRRQMVTTLGDELRIFSNFHSKVIGVALKDRSSILPAGHNANGAYWFDGKSGNFVSSTFYLKELPQWVKTFNDRKLADSYLSKPWSTLLPIEKYTESAEDNNPYEGLFKGEISPTFPHNLPELKKQIGIEIIRDTPFGNSLTKELAIAAIEGEDLGKDNYPDLLAISFSSTDHIGHQFAPQSIEVEDCYLRLDLEIESLLTYLENKIGKGNFLLFLTADHGAAQNANFLIDHKIPDGHLKVKDLNDSLKGMLKQRYGEGNWVLGVQNNQVYLNRELMASRRMNPDDVESIIARWLETRPNVHQAIPSHILRTGSASSKLELLTQNGLHPYRSGDITIIMDFGFMEWTQTGTTHGTSFAYDTHIPMLFYGMGVKQGEFVQAADIVDIAPTISSLANIPFPGATTGKVLDFK